jgi:hypothetical protein
MLHFWDWYFRNTRLQKVKIPEPKVGVNLSQEGSISVKR